MGASMRKMPLLSYTSAEYRLLQKLEHAETFSGRRIFWSQPDRV